MQSKDDVLLEEIHFLRQMLRDANEEKSIQVAIVRDEVVEKQRVIEELTRRGADAEASLWAAEKELVQLRMERGNGCGDARGVTNMLGTEPNTVRVEPRVQRLEEADGLHMLLEQQQLELEKQRKELERQHEELQVLRQTMCELRADNEVSTDRHQLLEEEWRNQLVELEGARGKEAKRSMALEADLVMREAELTEVRARLTRHEVPGDALAACASETEVRKWEEELREGMQLTLERLANRRVELRVAAITDAKDTALCKICYDHPASCALLPCRHHAFCRTCARRIESSSDAACPICRRRVTGRFETYAS